MKTRLLSVFLFLLLLLNTQILGQAAPTKTSPINNSIWETTTPTLTWYSTATTNVTYNLEVATSSTFGGTRVITETVTGWGAGQYTADAGDNLQPLTKYYWRVQVDGGTWSSIWSFTTTTGVGSLFPALSSPADGADWVSTTPTLTWWYVTNSNVTYRIQVNDDETFSDGNHEVDATLTTASSGTYNVLGGAGLVQGTPYYWRVEIDGTEEWSEIWEFTPTGGGSSVPSLSAPADGADWISTTPTLYWWMVTNSNVSYTVQVSSDGFNSEFEVSEVISGSSSANYQVLPGAGLTAGTTYEWRVSANGGTDWSTEWEFTPAAAAGGTSVPTLSSPVDGSIWVTLTPKLTWWYITSTNVSYTVNISDGDTYDEDRVVVAGATGSYNVVEGDALVAGTKYYWKVSADDGTTWSDIWDFTPPSTITTAPVPTLTAPINGVTYGDGTIPVLFYYSIGIGINYRIQIDTDSGFPSPTEINTTNTNYTFSGFIPGTTYYWRVSADAGSNYSGYWSFTTGGTVPSTSDYDYFVSSSFGSDSNDGLTLATPFETISKGITDAVDGESIYVLPGTYTENLTIAEQLTVQGTAASSVTIDGTHIISSGTVSLDGFTFETSGTAITIDASGSAIDDVEIANCTFELPSPGIGVYVGGASAANAVSNITIDGNTFNGPSSSGLSNPFKIGGDNPGGELGVDIDGVYFTDNTVSYGSIPINLYDQNINDILIDGNSFTNTDGVVYVWSMAEATPTGVLSNFVFTNNTVDATNTYGVGLGLDLNDALPGTNSDFTDANYGAGIAINNNSFVDVPGGYEIEAVSIFGVTTYVLDATNNYWGDTSGPSGGETDPVTSATASGSSSAVNSLPTAGRINWDPYDGANTTVTIETLAGQTGGATVNVDIDLDVVAGFTGITNTLIGKFYFNQNELDFLYANYGTGTLINTAGWTITFYEPLPGEVAFIAVGSNPINSDGELFSLNFQIIATSAGTDDITAILTEWYVDGTPAVLSFTDGGVTWVDAPSPSELRGDATLDYLVTIDDATAIINHVYGWSTLTDAQALINAAAADDVAGITFDDALAVYSYVVYGHWGAVPVASPSVQASVQFANVMVRDYDLIDFPLQVVNGESIRSVEVKFYYDSEYVDYQTFAAMILENDKFTNAMELADGIAQFSFASAELLNGTFNAGTVTLRLKDAIMPAGSEIRIEYSINSGEYTEGSTYTFGDVTDVDDINDEIPTTFHVSQNYPNPFNPTTVINYSLPEAAYVSIKIYDMLGREVKTLIQSELNAGVYNTYWNGDNSFGNKVASGAYIYRVVAGNYVVTKKMVLLK